MAEINAEINNETREALGEFMKGLSEGELNKAVGGLSKKQKGLLFSALGLVALASGGGYGLYKHYHPGQSEGGGGANTQPTGQGLTIEEKQEIHAEAPNGVFRATSPLLEKVPPVDPNASVPSRYIKSKKTMPSGATHMVFNYNEGDE